LGLDVRGLDGAASACAVIAGIRRPRGTGLGSARPRGRS
jgi:hypothetical protein